MLSCRSDSKPFSCGRSCPVVISCCVTQESAQKSGMLELAHYADYCFLTSGRILCLAANAMTPIVMAFLTLDNFRSPSALGFVMAARGLSVLAFLVVAGVIADRFPRRSVMVCAAATAGVSQALITALALTGQVRLWHLILLQIPNGAAASFLFPAMNATLPQTIPERLRRQAIAVSRTGMNGAMIGGAALSGTIVTLVGPGWGSAVNSTVYLCGALSFYQLKLRSAPAKGTESKSMIRDLREGWDEFRGRTWLWTTVVQYSVVNAVVAMGFETLGPLIAKIHLGGARSWGIIVAAQGAGLVLGAMAAAAWRPSRPLHVGWFATFAVVPAFVVLAEHLPLALIAVAALLSGMGIEVFGLNWDATMQKEIPADRLSRMYSYDAFGSNASVPVGQIAIAPGEALLGIYGLVWLCGLLVAGAAVSGLVTASSLPQRVAARPPASLPES